MREIRKMFTENMMIKISPWIWLVEEPFRLRRNCLENSRSFFEHLQDLFRVVFWYGFFRWNSRSVLWEPDRNFEHHWCELKLGVLMDFWLSVHDQGIRPFETERVSKFVVARKKIYFNLWNRLNLDVTSDKPTSSSKYEFAFSITVAGLATSSVNSARRFALFVLRSCSIFSAGVLTAIPFPSNFWAIVPFSLFLWNQCDIF